MVFMNKISQSSIGHFVCSLAGQVSFWKILICDTFTKGLFSKIPRHRQSNSILVHDLSFFNTPCFCSFCLSSEVPENDEHDYAGDDHTSDQDQLVAGLSPLNEPHDCP